MKIYRIHFCHPVKGQLRLFGGSKKKETHLLPIDSEESDLVEISLDKFDKGKWKLSFDWEYEGREFFYEKDIVIS